MSTWSTRAAVRECQLSAHGDLTVTERLGTLLDSGQFADVTIRVGQGTDYATFKAHRLLLATASQPLYRLVSTVQQGHADLNTFRITDIEPQAFKNVLKYIYTDEVNVNSVVDAFALLKAGKKWNLKKMNAQTIKYIEEFLDDYTPSNDEKKSEIFDLLVLSDAHSSELFEKCLTTVIKFAKDIIPCQGFLRLDDKTIKKLVSDPRFTFENQLGLFEAIRDWGMNQILLKGLNPAQLHPIIEDLLNHVDFEQIKDQDFMGTIFPSDCLGRAEIISFFMTRGLDVPRDNALGKKSDGPLQNGTADAFQRARRYKRGFKLPHKEIYQEHELRFRVDQNIKLLGVGFGFLFSNTDMGVTVHCQGPWERVQWTDMVQTYCRVSWEKMHSADLHLMFSEPARLEANHSYKVLVRVTRMTAGSSEVELWGGKDGQPFIEAEDAKFYFIKAAVNPNNEVDPREMETKQGMITELLYVIDDSPPTKIEKITTTRRRRPVVEPEEIYKPQEEISKPFVRRRPLLSDDDGPVETSNLARRREAGGSFLRWQHPSMATSTDIRPSRWAAREKTPEVKEATKSPEIKPTTTPSFLRKRSSPTRESRFTETPSFLKPKTTSTNPPDSPFGERLSRPSTRPYARTRAAALTNDTSATNDSSTSSVSRFGTSTSTPSTLSRFGRDSTTNTSRFGRDSSYSRYGRDTSSSRDTTSSSRYGQDSPVTSTTSRYGRDSSASRDAGTSAVSSINSNDTGSSLYRRTSGSGSSVVPSYLRSGSTATSDSTSTPSSSSLYRSNSTRLNSDLSSSKFGSRFGRDSSGSRYGTSYGSAYGTGTSPYGSSYSGSRFLSSGYVSRFR